MDIRKTAITILVIMLSACLPINQPPSPTEKSVQLVKLTPTNSPNTPTVEATNKPIITPTNVPTINSNIGQTILRFEFPFEPSPPGYLVNVKSTAFTENLMCVVENGEILNLDENSDNSNQWGICDTNSMTLNVLITDEITVTVILGGFPIVNEVTKTPDSVTEQIAEYFFESSLK